MAPGIAAWHPYARGARAAVGACSLFAVRARRDGGPAQLHAVRVRPPRQARRDRGARGLRHCRAPRQRFALGEACRVPHESRDQRPPAHERRWCSPTITTPCSQPARTGYVTSRRSTRRRRCVHPRAAHPKVSQASRVRAARRRGRVPGGARSQILIHDGERAQGRQAIIAKLRSVAQLHAGFKVIHEVKEVDCQPLGVVRRLERAVGRSGPPLPPAREQHVSRTAAAARRAPPRRTAARWCMSRGTCRCRASPGPPARPRASPRPSFSARSSRASTTSPTRSSGSCSDTFSSFCWASAATYAQAQRGSPRARFGCPSARAWLWGSHP